MSDSSAEPDELEVSTAAVEPDPVEPVPVDAPVVLESPSVTAAVVPVPSDRPPTSATGSEHAARAKQIQGQSSAHHRSMRTEVPRFTGIDASAPRRARIRGYPRGNLRVSRSGPLG